MIKKNIKNVVILGVGEMGSRHLQALIKCDYEINLYCIDPAEKSLKIASQRINGYNNNANINTVEFSSSVSILPKDIFFAVIATKADIRFEVLKLLLNHSTVKHVLLEKILFQTVVEINKARDLLNFYKTQAWVNSVRRMWPFYKNLKETLKDKNNISFTVQGGMWGMACNSVHMIDNFEWLTNCKLLSLQNNNLDFLLHNTKRSGVLEFSGILEGECTNKNKIKLISNSNDLKTCVNINGTTCIPFTIDIKGRDFAIKIKESRGISEIMFTNLSNRSKSENIKFELPYQSQLTNIVIKDLILNNKTDLTPYDDSANHHKLILAAFKRHAEKILEQPLDRCPIT